jgi:hypothetical protein
LRLRRDFGTSQEFINSTPLDYIAVSDFGYYCGVVAMGEHRREPRQKSFLRGRIYFNNRNSTAECLVRDISTRGARIIFEDEVTIPDVVDLYIPQKDQNYRSHIVWRRGTEAGICFAIPEQAAQATEPGDLAARVEKLEHEIELLKRTLKRLKSDSTAGSDFEAA